MTTIQTATFNPAVRTYIFAYGCLVLLGSIIGIPFLIPWMLGLGQILSSRYYKSLECELTDRALRFKKGLMVSVEKTIPLDNIQDMTFVEGPLLRRFGLAMIKVETAGQSDSDGHDLTLVGIKDALDFRDRVMSQREAISSRTGDTGGQASGSSEMIALLSEIRDSLKRIEVNRGLMDSE